MNRLRVAVLELPSTWGPADAALPVVDRALRDGPAVDLVVLPEASLTGYVSPEGDFDLEPFAEPIDGPSARHLAEIATSHRVHLVGPLVERDGDSMYNAMIGLRPDGTRFLHYRKRHPWYPERWATPGADPHPVVDILEWRVTIAICFDLHFVGVEGADALAAADLLLFPSAWVEEDDSRHTVLPALARRFDVAIANANWGRGRVALPGQGGTAIYDRRGQVMALADGALRADAALEKRVAG